MHTYDERIRAVELYIELGKRVRPTIRQLGYHTNNALKGWYHTYQQQRWVPLGDTLQSDSRHARFGSRKSPTLNFIYTGNLRCMDKTRLLTSLLKM